MQYYIVIEPGRIGGYAAVMILDTNTITHSLSFSFSFSFFLLSRYAWIVGFGWEEFGEINKSLIFGMHIYRRDLEGCHLIFYFSISQLPGRIRGGKYG